MPRDGKPVDPVTRSRVVELFAEGKLGRNAIAREVGLATATITTIARQEGHEFDRSMSELAVKLRSIDMAVMRADLAKAALMEAWDALDSMHAPSVTYQFEAGHQTTEYNGDGVAIRTYNTKGEFRELVLDQPTFSDQRNLATVFGIMVTKAAELTRSVDTGGSIESVSFIDGMNATLQIVKDRILGDPASDPTVEPVGVSRDSMLAEFEVAAENPDETADDSGV